MGQAGFLNNIIPIDEEIKDNIRVIFGDIFQFISNHYAEKLTAVQVAKKFGLRQSDFSAYFKKITGKSFNEYLNYIRICKAKRMLISSEKNISEIAFTDGLNILCQRQKAVAKLRPLVFY